MVLSHNVYLLSFFSSILICHSFYLFLIKIVLRYPGFYQPRSMSVCPLIDVRVNELLSFHLLFCYAGCQTQYRRHQTGKVKIAGEDAFKHHIFLSVSNIFTSLDFLLTLGSAKGSNTSYYSFIHSCRFSFHFSFFVCLHHISKRSIFFYAEYV